jgi:hypothetical protein
LEELEPALGPIGSSIFGRAIFAQSKTMRGYRGGNGGANLKSKKGGVMKRFEFLDPTRATLLIALAIGLGIAVHEVFFLIALAIAIAALVQSVAHNGSENIARTKWTHRHP